MICILALARGSEIPFAVERAGLGFADQIWICTCIARWGLAKKKGSDLCSRFIYAMISVGPWKLVLTSHARCAKGGARPSWRAMRLLRAKVCFKMLARLACFFGIPYSLSIFKNRPFMCGMFVLNGNECTLQPSFL